MSWSETSETLEIQVEVLDSSEEAASDWMSEDILEMGAFIVMEYDAIHVETKEVTKLP